MTVYDEIFQQPRVLAEMYQANKTKVKEIAAAVGGATSVFITARGTSDNAARYAQYVWGAFNHLPVTLATPSLFSIYKSPPRLAPETLVVGVSQSGRSPDIVAVLEEGRRQGKKTLAITNKPDSPLAEVADHVIDIRAPEKAVAATGSYTAQLQAIAMLSAALAGDDERMGEIAAIPDWIDTVLKQDDEIATAALRYRYMDQCVVLGRGFNYATAYEWALKLKEMAYVVADPYSSADFRHGPIAVVDRGFPVMAIAPQGAVFEDMLEVIEKLADEYRAELMVISNRPDVLDLADSPVHVPQAVSEWLSPLVTIVPAQLFSYHLTHIKGYDTEVPRGLSKVTLTE